MNIECEPEGFPPGMNILCEPEGTFLPGSWKENAGKEIPGVEVPAYIEVKRSFDCCTWFCDCCCCCCSGDDCGIYIHDPQPYNVDVFTRVGGVNPAFFYYYDAGWRTCGGLSQANGPADPSSPSLGSGGQYPCGCGTHNSWKGDGNQYKMQGEGSWEVKYYMASEGPWQVKGGKVKRETPNVMAMEGRV